MILKIFRKIHVAVKGYLSFLNMSPQSPKLTRNKIFEFCIFHKIKTCPRVKRSSFYQTMQSNMAGMTNDFKIRKFIVFPITIDMMNFKSSLSFITYIALIRKIIKGFSSVLLFNGSLLKTFKTAIRSTSLPVAMNKIFTACFTYTGLIFSRNGRKIAFLTAKDLFIGRKFKFFATECAFFKNYRKLMSRSTFLTTKFGMLVFTIKCCLTLLAYFFHRTSCYSGEHPNGYQHYKQEQGVNYA